jgi:hypothetical protein
MYEVYEVHEIYLRTVVFTSFTLIYFTYKNQNKI